MIQMTDEQRRLAQVCIDIEKQIWEAFGNKPHCPVCNDDWTDAHQEYLEFQWFKDEINELYQNAQRELFTALGQHDRKIKTAQEYYDKQKDFEDTVAYYKKHHINGF